MKLYKRVSAILKRVTDHVSHHLFQVEVKEYIGICTENMINQRNVQGWLVQVVQVALVDQDIQAVQDLPTDGERERECVCVCV